MNWNHCPNCGATDKRYGSYGGVADNDGYIAEEFSCPQCAQTWTEVYSRKDGVLVARERTVGLAPEWTD